MMVSPDPLTRLATLATLSPKGARVIVKSYAGQETSLAKLRCRLTTLRKAASDHPEP